MLVRTFSSSHMNFMNYVLIHRTICKKYFIFPEMCALLNTSGLSQRSVSVLHCFLHVRRTDGILTAFFVLHAPPVLSYLQLLVDVHMQMCN